MILQSSQRPPELLFYTKKSYRILQLQLQLQSYKSIHIQPTRAHYITLQRILHPESSSTYRRQRALRVLLLHYRGQRDLQSRFQKRNSMHRRQGDLLEMHPCVLQDLPMTFQAFQPQVLTKATPVTPVTPETFQSFQSFMTFQPFQAILQVPVFPGNPTHSSILQLECIFYIFHNFYGSIGFHRKLHRVPVEQLQTLQTLHSSKKERCCDIGQTCIGKDVKMTYFLE